MSHHFNLPDGVSVWDIPGNRPEDAAWEAFLERELGARDYDDLTPEEQQRLDEAFQREWEQRVEPQPPWPDHDEEEEPS